ncbi:glutathione S-transferase family protein [Parasphingopyxis sp. CP4]|uniref:glutathione S-transferase family protein n=1 Tax=Parasphingopyxis sp. CP4 TaxID=2724527 RepID=UPI0015A3D694|nr:glutathione S-transferase family protein [Parasphingopyxis sp. CP4]QLC21041.1 glutathione S-transferase family protein [Parasphingopyxis sp. CP4]
MIIYGVSLSPFVRKAMAFLHEKGIDFDHQLVMPGADDPEFRESSPFGKVPGFRDGDFTLSDSSAIAHYVESKFPDPALIPADPEARGKTIWFDEFGDTMLVPAGGAIFFNRVVATMMGQEGDEAAAVTAEQETLPPLLAYLEGLLADEPDYLVGDSITLADIAVAAPFKNLEYGKAAIDWDAYPKTRAYTDRILGRDSFAKILAMDAAMMGG